MTRIVDRDLESLREAILRMGALSEKILTKAWTAVQKQDTELSRQVAEDDLEIDQLEVDIDAAVLGILALQSPVAIDLREVIAIKTMATDLERVGDLARNLAKSVSTLPGVPTLPPGLGELQDGCRRLLRRSLDAFAERDPDRAREVLADDDAIDDLESRVIAEQLDEIRSNPARATDHVNVILIARDLERIADHATNIAEDVVLVAEAQNVKHAEKLSARAARAGSV